MARVGDGKFCVSRLMRARSLSGILTVIALLDSIVSVADGHGVAAANANS